MSIAIIGMLDEREESLGLLKKCIEARGHKTVLMDITIGKGAIAPTLQADISCNELTRAGRSTPQEIRDTTTEEEKNATAAMTRGLQIRLLELYQKGELQGVVAVAGLTGSLISLPAMKSLPYGIPKLLISSSAATPSHAKGFSDFFGMRDITVMHSVVDTVGLNPFVRTLMINGAGSICGMVEEFTPFQREDGPSIAMTEWGYCEMGAHHIRTLLEDRFNVVSFHANGVGDKAAVELVSEGLFDAFIDLVPCSFSEHLLGGNRAAGPDRLDAGRNSGRPYVLSPCGFEMISCGPIQRKEQGDPLWTSRKLSERKLYIQDAMRVQARTDPQEMKTIAREVAGKLNLYPRKELVKIVIPVKGFSILSVEDGPLYDPGSDQTFIDQLGKSLDTEIEIVKVNNHINSREFARATADALNRALL